MVYRIMRRSTNSDLIKSYFCVILEYTICTTSHLQQSKSNILKERKKIKIKRVRETKERKINLMRNTCIKKGEWNTKERRNKNRKLRRSEGWR